MPPAQTRIDGFVEEHLHTSQTDISKDWHYTKSRLLKFFFGLCRTNGKRLGRPKSKVDTDKVIECRKQNKSIRQIAGEMSLSRRTVERTLRAYC